jgi:histidyl-tRNA synthetase
MHTWAGLAKLYYLGPMFRREKPQKGRYRQFYQIGAEVLGTSEHPAIDAEVIEMLIVLLERCRLECWTLFINSIGCKECRPAYVVKLREALLKVKAKLGPDSQRRIETNPLRVLDSKLPEEQAIIEKLPRITEHLCADCREHFAAVQEQLKLRGIPYEVNWRLVRGLDYYMRTTFEITSSALGAQNALVGGGRYDGLVELLGGPAGIKGIGFALGEDRFIEVIKDAGKVAAERPADVFIAWIPSDRGISRIYETAVKLARRLRAENLTVELPVEEAKLKKSLGLADKLGARYAVLLGEDEIASGSYILRRMADGEQKKLRESELVDYLKSESARNAVARR